MRRQISFIVHIIDSISNWSGKAISFLLLVIIAVLIYEVVLRYFLNSPTFWAHETTQQMFGVYSILLGAYTLCHFGHVNMDVLYSRLSVRRKALLDVFTSAFFFFWCGVLLIYGTKFAVKAISIWEHSSTPFGPPVWDIKLMIPLGALLIILQGLAKFFRDLNIALTGRALE